MQFNLAVANPISTTGVETLPQPSLLAPHLNPRDAIRRTFVCLRKEDRKFDEVDASLPTSAAVVTKLTGTSENSEHNGVALNHPLRLFSRQPHFTSLGAVAVSPSPSSNLSPSSSMEKTENSVFLETIAVVVKIHTLNDARQLSALLTAPEDHGLALVGLRYLDCDEDMIADASSTLSSLKGFDCGCKLVMAIRGPSASTRWDNAVGPTDPMLARRTDPHSLRAKHGKDKSRNLVRSVPNMARNSLRELQFFFGGRMRMEVSSTSTLSQAQTFMKGEKEGVGGAWPSRRKESLKEVGEAGGQGSRSVSRVKPPPVRPAYYLSPNGVASCQVKVPNSKPTLLGKVLDAIVSTAGFKVTALEGVAPASISCEGEGGAAAMRNNFLGLEGVEGVVIDDEEATGEASDSIPTKEDASLAIGNTPGPILDQYKGEIDEVQVVIVTPDSFERDFTGVDVPIGTLANVLLSPFPTIDGAEVSTNTNLGTRIPRCKFKSELLAAKMINKLSKELAHSIARDLTLVGKDAAVMERVLQRGRCLAFVMKGKPGFRRALKERVGPEKMEGGSLAARNYNPNCLKAMFAGDDDEPALARGVSRQATYRVICRLFTPDDVCATQVGDLFPERLPNEIVALNVRQVGRLGTVLKRAERGGFDLVGMRLAEKGRVLLCLRRFNGAAKWAEITGDSATGSGASFDDVDTIGNSEGMDGIYGAGNWNLKAACDEKRFSGGMYSVAASVAPTEGFAGFKQEGLIDDFQEKKFVRASISLNETVCVVFPSEVLRSSGLAKLVDAVKRNASGFVIVGARLVWFSMRSAAKWWEIRNEEGTIGGDKGAYGMKKNEIIDLVAGEPGQCSVVLCLECDNAIVRSRKLISQGADGGGKGKGGEGERVLGSARKSGGEWGRRRRDDGGAEAFLDEDGEPKCLGSLNSNMAKRECAFFFSDIWGEDKLE